MTGQGGGPPSAPRQFRHWTGTVAMKTKFRSFNVEDDLFCALICTDLEYVCFLTTNRLRLRVNCSARCVIKSCFYFFPYLLCGCATVIAQGVKAYCPEIHLTPLIKIDFQSNVLYRFTFFDVGLLCEKTNINPTRSGYQKQL